MPEMIVQTLDVPRCRLGEGALWDNRTHTFWWVDILGLRVYAMQWDTGVTRTYTTTEHVGFVALCATPDRLVLGLRQGLSTLHIATGAIERLHSNVEPETPSNRTNDGIATPDGAIIFGTMDFACVAATGQYWRFDPASQHMRRLSLPAVPVTNGPAMSIDGASLFTVDSIGRCICKHTISGGEIIASAPFVRFTDPSWGVPDGIVLDDENYLWCGHYGGARLTRFSPQGEVDVVIALPAPNVTKLAFVGDDLRSIVATTASDGVDLTEFPDAGKLFLISNTRFRGVPSACAAL